MTDFMNLLRRRRSTRLFTDEKLDEDQIGQLEEALLRSPTSRSRNPWHFIRVDEKALLEQASLAKQHGSGFLAGAAVAYVICADETVSDVWTEDCSIAAITLQYTAEALGLGSCWAQIRLRQHDDSESAETYLRKLLSIPEHIRVASVIGIGYPAEMKKGHTTDGLHWQKMHHNRY